jgi:hypothetical protein
MAITPLTIAKAGAISIAGRSARRITRPFEDLREKDDKKDEKKKDDESSKEKR